VGITFLSADERGDIVKLTRDLGLDHGLGGGAGRSGGGRSSEHAGASRQPGSPVSRPPGHGRNRNRNQNRRRPDSRRAPAR
jgi:hypothetical protein